jgi:hypothetical protein
VFHMSMLFSRRVARQVCAFLNNGRFERPECNSAENV